MADDLAFHHIHHELRDIGGMVGNAFKVFADESEANRAGDRSRIFDHEGQKLPKQLVCQIIHKVVVGSDFPCQYRI